MPRSILHVLLIDRSDKSPNGLAPHDYYITGSYHATLQRRHPLGVVCYGSTAALVGAAQSPTPLLWICEACARYRDQLRAVRQVLRRSTDTT